jgi:hypothetical protein
MPRKGSKENPLTSGDLKSIVENGTLEKEIEITGATLNGDFCNYSYDLLKGKTKGDSVNRKGSNIFHDDLKKAFWKLNVHLALICEEIDALEVEDIEALENIIFEDIKDENGKTIEKDVFDKGSIADIVTRFKVSSFAISGTGENESVVLIGTKTLSTGDHVGLKSPKTHWEGEYLFINELRSVVGDLKQEVEEYSNGKAAPKLVQQELPLNNELVEEGV